MLQSSWQSQEPGKLPIVRIGGGAISITLSPQLEKRIRAVASAQQRSPQELVEEACDRHLAALEAASQHDLYAQGYERLPEDTAELAALLPYLQLPGENLKLRESS